jgi:hypothetical protein
MSSTRASLRPSGARSISTVQVGLVAFAVIYLAIAALMVVAPHVFFEEIGPYGLQNDHYLRDLASWYLAFGVLLLVAYRRVAWRTPVLFGLALQSGLHSVNHLADIGAAHPRWLGPANFASLTLATLTLLWLARESMQPSEVQR